MNTLAIGEVHHFASVKLFIAKFLPELRKARPNQEIMLFTEFLPEGPEYTPTLLNETILLTKKIFLPQETADAAARPSEGAALKQIVFQTALDQNIRLIGLEPKEVLRDSSLARSGQRAFFQTDSLDTDRSRVFFASLNGLKWRNEMWTQTIQKYRAEHPDALFIIYAGEGHVDCRMPFSLTAPLDPQKTFVLGVLPTKENVLKAFPNRKETDLRLMWDLFSLDRGKPLEGFDQPFLYWKDPQAKRLTGADAFINVEKQFIPESEKQMEKIK